MAMDLAKLPEGRDLTEQQRKFVGAILQGEEAGDAARIAGYGDGAHGATILAGSRVQAAIRAACDAELGGSLRVKAMLCLKKLITDDRTPSATKFNAAKLIIERGDDRPGAETKPLSAMTIEELEATIRAKEAELVNVTPSNGADG